MSALGQSARGCFPEAGVSVRAGKRGWNGTRVWLIRLPTRAPESRLQWLIQTAAAASMPRSAAFAEICSHVPACISFRAISVRCNSLLCPTSRRSLGSTETSASIFAQYCSNVPSLRMVSVAISVEPVPLTVTASLLQNLAMFAWTSVPTGGAARAVITTAVCSERPSAISTRPPSRTPSLTGTRSMRSDLTV